MDWLKEALSDNGEASSSRLATFILVILAVTGYMLAMVIIIHSYFSVGIIPTGDSILVYCLGGSTGSALSGAGIYFANQYGNKPVQVSESLNIENDEH